MRIKAIVTYDGTAYGGWQLQKNAPSIQGELEKVLFPCADTAYRCKRRAQPTQECALAAVKCDLTIETSVPGKSCPFVLTVRCRGTYAWFPPAGARAFTPA